MFYLLDCLLDRDTSHGPWNAHGERILHVFGKLFENQIVGLHPFDLFLIPNLVSLCSL